jgi:negative regulator of replication initiation
MENNAEKSLPAIFKTNIFKIIETNGDKIKTKCQLCVGLSGEISGSTKSTTNFLTHIRRKHPQRVDVLNEVIQRKTMKRSSIMIDNDKDTDGQPPSKKPKDVKCTPFTIASANSARKGIAIEKVITNRQ